MQLITIDNQDLISEVKRYTAIGFTPAQIAKELRLRTDEVAKIVKELNNLGLLSQEAIKEEIERAYSFQVIKTKNWTIESIAISIKLLVNDLHESKENFNKINDLRNSIKATEKKLRIINRKLQKLNENNNKEDKEEINNLKEKMLDLDFELADYNVDLDWLIRTTRKVSSKDVEALTRGLVALEDIEKNKIGGSIVNQNTLVLAGMNLEEARKIIANDPVMQEIVKAEYKRIDDDGKDITNELMEGFEDFKSGTKI